MAATESAEMNKAEYWDKRYQSADNQPPREWHMGYDELEDYLKEDVYPHWPADAKIMHPGAGSSHLPLEMRKRGGYTNITCAEFSPAVIAQMQPLDPEIKWVECDVRGMSDFASDSYDVLFDKACLEALCGWGPKHLLKEIPDIIVSDSRLYSQEAYRVLKPGGWFIIISVFEPRYVHHLLKCEGTNWEDVHPPKALTASGWMQTRAYCLKKPEPNAAVAHM
ncbi:S-adenosyl-L-methionine-dependent methyltransferase [Apiospora phragmitis]|uniref:S-adenosyl-L-methionine-dependent methyltransferase n=1 Tax=Apiospora phragmitis TaxID=2905665 RepID=A0ABR1VFH4_9PEZI